jgi:23S rRNA pseudouridine2457 synthase
MSTLLLLNKPFRTLSQFTDKNGRQTLADWVDCKRYPDYYPAGRLDYDSEGLIILTNDGAIQNHLANPRFKLPKTYWVQVEGTPSDEGLCALRKGLQLKDGLTKPCIAKLLDPPTLWDREPPVRSRAQSPTHWLELTLTEGKNRQVRRMTAAIGLPTLRLIRSQIGLWNIVGLAPGESRELQVNLPSRTTPNLKTTKNRPSRQAPKARDQ